MREDERDTNGVEVFVVTDPEPDSCAAGVYFSLQRACQYIDNWMKDAGAELLPTDAIREICHKTWDYRGYRIEQTPLRF